MAELSRPARGAQAATWEGVFQLPDALACFQSPSERLSRAAAQPSPQRTMTLSLRARFQSQGANLIPFEVRVARIQ